MLHGQGGGDAAAIQVKGYGAHGVGAEGAHVGLLQALEHLHTRMAEWASLAYRDHGKLGMHGGQQIGLG